MLSRVARNCSLSLAAYIASASGLKTVMITGVSKPRASRSIATASARSRKKRERTASIGSIRRQSLTVGDRLFGKRIGEIRHDLGNVEIELLVKEAQGRLGHCPTGALRLEVMPETDRNAIELTAVYGCHNPFSTRHVVDLKTTPRRLSAFVFAT